MNPDRTIKTTASGRRAAAARDGRIERGQEPTRPIMLASDDRLRDAAPDMLAALQEVARVYAAHGYGIHRIAGPLVLAAISKATGRP